MKHNDKQQDVIGIIQKRQFDNELGLVWLTPEIQIETKQLVRDAKRAYATTFKTNTSADDVFWPLVKQHVDSITGNLDYDTGDVKITSKNIKFKGTSYLLSELLRLKLKDFEFGRLLNETAHQLTRDGSVVIRTITDQKEPRSYLVDMENLWTDFNNADPSWFLERIPMKMFEIPDSWNQDKIPNEATSKFKDIGDKLHDDVVIAYRYEGMMPLGWINGTEDKNQVYGLLWITGFEFGEPYVQSRKILGKDMTARTYDYSQFVPNSARFISVGVPEALNELQRYINLVVNNRIQRANLSSTGLIEIRKGSGITPNDIKELAHGGAITVTQLGADIKSTSIQDVSATSFNEEANISNLSDKLTGNTEISRGQINRSGVTLGQANLEAQFASQRFQYHKEALGFMFESILDKWLDVIVKHMDKEETVKIVDEQILSEVARELGRFDKEELKVKASEKFGQRGVDSINNIPDEVFNQRRLKNNEFKLMKKELKDHKFVVEVTINSENLDLNAIANNIVATLPIVSQLPNGQQLVGPLTEKLFETLGMSTIQFKTGTTTPQVQAAQQVSKNVLPEQVNARNQ